MRRARKRLGRRRALAAGLDDVARRSPLCAALCGALVLAARTFEPRVPAALALALALAWLVAQALLAARRAWPSASVAAVWLDVRSGGSGEVLTEAELGASAWSARAVARLESALEQLPRPAWRAAFARTAPSACFVLAALWVPIPATPLDAQPFDTERARERIEEKLEALRDALALDPQLERELAERFERAEQRSDSDRPDSTFEALDRLEQRLDEQAARALDAAEAASAEIAHSASDPHLDHAQEALDAALAQMREAGLNKGLSAQALSTLGVGLEALPPGVQLDSAQLAGLSRELNAALARQLGKLAAARMIDARALERMLAASAGAAGEFDPDHECDENCKRAGGT